VEKKSEPFDEGVLLQTAPIKECKTYPRKTKAWALENYCVVFNVQALGKISCFTISRDHSYYKYKKKLVILQSIGIVPINSKETRVITYT